MLTQLASGNWLDLSSVVSIQLFQATAHTDGFPERHRVVITYHAGDSMTFHQQVEFDDIIEAKSYRDALALVVNSAKVAQK